MKLFKQVLTCVIQPTTATHLPCWFLPQVYRSPFLVTAAPWVCPAPTGIGRHLSWGFSCWWLLSYRLDIVICNKFKNASYFYVLNV